MGDDFDYDSVVESVRNLWEGKGSRRGNRDSDLDGSDQTFEFEREEDHGSKSSEDEDFESECFKLEALISDPRKVTKKTPRVVSSKEVSKLPSVLPKSWPIRVRVIAHIPII